MKRISPSLVVAMIALLVSLSSGAIAASRLLPRNSVGSAQIINHSVKKADLGTKLPRGPRGLRGATGDQGPPGVFSTQNVTQVSGNAVVVAPGTSGSATASCPSGAVALGGGWAGNAPPPTDVSITRNGPVSTGSWQVDMINWASGSASFHAQVVCAFPVSSAPTGRAGTH